MCDHFHPELNERIATLIYGYPADLAGDVDFPLPDYSMDNNAAAKLLEHVETKRRSLLPDVNRHLQHILDEQPGPLTLTDQLRLIDPYEICVAVLGALDANLSK